MKFYAIRVVQDGQVGYLKGKSCFDVDAVVPSPLNAAQFQMPEDLDFIGDMIRNCVWPEMMDKGYAKSGVRIDAEPKIVHVMTCWEEIKCMTLEEFGVEIEDYTKLLKLNKGAE